MTIQSGCRPPDTPHSPENIAHSMVPAASMPEDRSAMTHRGGSGASAMLLLLGRAEAESRADSMSSSSVYGSPKSLVEPDWLRALKVVRKRRWDGVRK